MRLFVSDGTAEDWTELTFGTWPVVRLTAPDLKRAQRDRASIRSDQRDVDVILDVAVTVPGDIRASVFSDGTVHYAGTIAGLAGLIADIEGADVADGVTLVASADAASDELRDVGRDVLRLLADRDRKSA